jgi:penicillin-binding protein 1C
MIKGQKLDAFALLATLSRPADQYGLGLVLGNGEVRLLDLANAYACLARGGVYASVRVLEGDERAATGRRVFSQEACWILAEMLSGDERAMDTTGHAADVRLPRMAWKTGTSAGLRDAWAVAYNPDVVIGVWVGRPDGAGSDQLIGRTAATPIAWDLFRSLYPDNQSPWYERPAGVTARLTCAVSGRPPGPHCQPGAEDWSIARVTQCEPCAGHGSQIWNGSIFGMCGQNLGHQLQRLFAVRTPVKHRQFYVALTISGLHFGHSVPRI